VAIIFPDFYVDYNIKTTATFAEAISYLCKSAAILGKKEIEFEIEGMTVMQVYAVEDVMRKFGIEMTHDHRVGHTIFYADITGLQKLLRGEE
jgi:hypothetical protein